MDGTDGKGSPGGGKRPAERKMGHCQRQILCSWRGVCPLKACWELDSPVGTGVLLYDPGGDDKGENLLGMSLNCSAKNHSEKLSLNIYPTSMG